MEYNLAKQTCRGTMCNVGHDQPDNPDPEFRCYSCIIRKDHLGTVGKMTKNEF